MGELVDMHGNFLAGGYGWMFRKCWKTPVGTYFIEAYQESRSSRMSYSCGCHRDESCSLCRSETWLLPMSAINATRRAELFMIACHLAIWLKRPFPRAIAKQILHAAMS